MKMYLISSNNIGAIVGIITKRTKKNIDGYRFLSWCQTGNSRKNHPTPTAAAPRGFDGYLVKAADPQDALVKIKKYSDGALIDDITILGGGA
jgi:hypothetical protein